jgi:hypothetical protein
VSIRESEQLDWLAVHCPAKGSPSDLTSHCNTWRLGRLRDAADLIEQRNCRETDPDDATPLHDQEVVGF